MASGPAALNSSRPTLATPNHGCSAVASCDGLDEVVDVEGERQAVAVRERSVVGIGASGGRSRPRRSVQRPWAAPIRSARSATPCASHQRSSSSSTRAAARGSAKVAVPTCTAEAPASSSSTASVAVGHAADAHDGQVGQGRVDVVDGPDGDRVDRPGRTARPRRRRARGGGARRRWPCPAAC